MRQTEVPRSYIIDTPRRILHCNRNLRHSTTCSSSADHPTITSYQAISPEAEQLTGQPVCLGASSASPEPPRHCPARERQPPGYLKDFNCLTDSSPTGIRRQIAVHLTYALCISLSSIISSLQNSKQTVMLIVYSLLHYGLGLKGFRSNHGNFSILRVIHQYSADLRKGDVVLMGFTGLLMWCFLDISNWNCGYQKYNYRCLLIWLGYAMTWWNNVTEIWKYLKCDRK